MGVSSTLPTFRIGQISRVQFPRTMRGELLANLDEDINRSVVGQRDIFHCGGGAVLKGPFVHKRSQYWNRENGEGKKVKFLSGIMLACPCLTLDWEVESIKALMTILKSPLTIKLPCHSFFALVRVYFRKKCWRTLGAYKFIIVKGLESSMHVRTMNAP